MQCLSRSRMAGLSPLFLPTRPLSLVVKAQQRPSWQPGSGSGKAGSSNSGRDGAGRGRGGDGAQGGGGRSGGRGGGGGGSFNLTLHSVQDAVQTMRSVFINLPPLQPSKPKDATQGASPAPDAAAPGPAAGSSTGSGQVPRMTAAEETDTIQNVLHAKRPRYAMVGQEIQILTNHALLGLIDIKALHQYSVAVRKVLPAPKRTRSSSSGSNDGTMLSGLVAPEEAGAVLHALFDAHGAAGAWVHDGKEILYSTRSDLASLIASASSGSGNTGLVISAVPEYNQAEKSAVLRCQLSPQGTSSAESHLYQLTVANVATIDVQQALAAARSRDSSSSSRAGGGGLPGTHPPASAPSQISAPPPQPAAVAQLTAALELASRAQALASEGVVRAGRSLLNSRLGGSGSSGGASGVIGPPPSLVKALFGFRSSLSLGSAAGPTLAVDASLGAVMRDGPLLNVLCEAAEASSPADLQGCEVEYAGSALIIVPAPQRKLEKERWLSRSLSEQLEGVEVKLQYGKGQSVKLTRLSDQPASKLSFTVSGDSEGGESGGGGRSRGGEGKTQTVVAYFQAQYGITLRYPDLPCVLNKKGAAFPLELAVVRKTARRSAQLSAKQQADYIKQSAMRPADRIRRILNALTSPAGLGGLMGAVAGAFGLKLAKGANLLQVPARLLRGPFLEYSLASSSSTVQKPCIDAANSGVWRPARELHAFVPAAWRSGAVVAFCQPGSPEVQQMAQSVLSTMRSQLGCTTLPQALPIVWVQNSSSRTAAEKALRDALATHCKQQPALLVVVLPAKGDSDMVYGLTKALVDSSGQAASQCVSELTLSKKGYLVSLCDAMNAKLGGTNRRLPGGLAPPATASTSAATATTVSAADAVRAKLMSKFAAPTSAATAGTVIPELQGKRVMILGADLSRFGPQSVSIATGSSSGSASGGGWQQGVRKEYAAVVGTVDAAAQRYMFCCMEQDAAGDIITDMQAAAEAMLQRYASGCNGLLPDVLLVVRDGVSDSQFDAVLASEYRAVQQAVNAVAQSQRRPPPTIDFLVVQKSHNTRLFRGSANNLDTVDNVLPGTLVEERILPAEDYAFYLNSHAALQGTNRVPRYHVLVHASGLSPEALQHLLFWETHLYPACNRSISVPLAVKYADAAAERARTLAPLLPSVPGHVGFGPSVLCDASLLV